MTHRGPFQPLPCCDSVILRFCYSFVFYLQSKRMTSYRGKAWSGTDYPCSRLLERGPESSRYKLNLSDSIFTLVLGALTDLIIL